MSNSFMVASDPTAAYYTAVIYLGWNCEYRNIPIFQKKDGATVKFVADGLLIRTFNKIKNDLDIEMYLGLGWRQRQDTAYIIKSIENEMFKVMLEIKNE